MAEKHCGLSMLPYLRGDSSGCSRAVLHSDFRYVQYWDAAAFNIRSVLTFKTVDLFVPE